MSVAASCSLNDLSTAAKCFDCLSLTEKEALKVQFMALALQGFGGVDLTNLRTRNSTVSCFTCEPDFRLDSMEVAVWQKLASLAGANVNLPINQLRALVSCVPCGEQKSTRAAWLYLLCQLTFISR